ncbi:MAG: T9SS type A sorting domain-containing protein, partial [Nitrososphaera sp.]
IIPTPSIPARRFNSLSRSGYVTLKVYNTLGAEVATLVAENLSAGRHAVEWNANGLAGGV